MKRQIVYKKFDSVRKFGVEIEVDNTVSKAKIKQEIGKISLLPIQLAEYVPSDNNDYWHIKNDASCGPKGWEGPCGYEVVTPVMSGWSDLVHLGEVVDRLREVGLRINKHCGLHVHVDVGDLTQDQVGIIVGYWYKIQNKLTLAMPPHRRGNRYCRRIFPFWLDTKPANGLRAWDSFKPNDLTEGSMDRHFNLNLVNYAKSVWNPWACRRPTLELRWPEGTLSGRDVKNWVRLFVNFVDTASNLPAPVNFRPCKNLEEILTVLGLHTAKNFIFLVRGCWTRKGGF